MRTFLLAELGHTLGHADGPALPDKAKAEDEADAGGQRALDGIRLGEAHPRSPVVDKEGDGKAPDHLPESEDGLGVHGAREVALEDVGLENTSGGGETEEEEATADERSDPVELLVDADAEDEACGEEEGQDREQSPETVLGLTRALLALKVADNLVTNDTTRPLAENTTDTVGEERAAEGDGLEAVRRRLELLGGDDGNTNGPSEQATVVDGGNGDGDEAELLTLARVTRRK